MNRLINESSPYLKQHSSNPVDWFPWSDEAFMTAKEHNKLIFLSIGYHTCHWCHVMEKESFEDFEVAKLLNDNFVNIKVDREERPDIDMIYMKVCQAMTGSGGWPLTIIMTPDKKPFFAGTYFPKNDKPGMPGIISIIQKVCEIKETNSHAFVEFADKLLSEMKKEKKSIKQNIHPPESYIAQNLNILKSNYDNNFGGFGLQPKFPQPHLLMFLTDHHNFYNDSDSLNMATDSLTKITRGGIFDHLGFGFHRYSTDRFWNIPHFEKMLYDQALMIFALTETYRTTKNNYFIKIAEKTAGYMTQNLRSPKKSFYCAEDADSEGYEGKYFIWSYEELKESLGGQFKEFEKLFDISKHGNFEDSKNILYYRDKDITHTIIPEDIRQKLLKLRKKRIQPNTDTKITADWNGLAVSALARIALFTGKKEYSDYAISALDSILQDLYSNGTLFHYRKNEKEYVEGFLNDYSFVINGCIYIYLSSREERYLDTAKKLDDMLYSLFFNSGHLKFKSKFSEKEILEPDDPYDSAIPSGVSVELENLLYLEKITGEKKYKELFDNLVNSYKPSYSSNPYAFSYFLRVLLLEKQGWLKLTYDPSMRNNEKLIEIIRNLNLSKYRIVSECKKMPDNALIQICDDQKCMIYQNTDELAEKMNSFL